MAKKKKSKSSKKVTKKTPIKKTKKKVTKKAAKKTAVKAKISKKKAVKKTATKKVVAKTKPVEAEVAIVAKPVKKLRKKRITKAETLRLMQQEQLVKKWHALYKKLDTLEATKYSMRESFEVETAISHIKLGWGFILSNTNDRLEVLFEDGIKNLISNYKSR